jgi:hypothetical protein
MKVGIEWRPSMASRSKIGGQPATFSLLSSIPLHYLPLSSTTTYKRVAKGSLLLHLTST